MADFATHEAQEESESHAKLYLKVWVALLVLTVLEYFYAKMFAGAMLTLVLGLLLLAGIKAGLVGQYFMHVKWEGKWIYAIIIPACILAAIAICGLLPDIANAPTKDPIIEDETAWTAPSGPAPYPFTSPVGPDSRLS